MNGIWVRSEDGERLYAVTAITVYGGYAEDSHEDGGPYRLMGDGCYLAGYKTKKAAMKQIDDIQNMISLFGTAMQKHQHNPTPDEAVTYTTIKPKIYDLRERKVKEE